MILFKLLVETVSSFNEVIIIYCKLQTYKIISFLHEAFQINISI